MKFIKSGLIGSVSLMLAVSAVAETQQPMPPEGIMRAVRAAGHDPEEVHRRAGNTPEEALWAPTATAEQTNATHLADPSVDITSLPIVAWPTNARAATATAELLQENRDGFPEFQLIVSSGNTRFAMESLPEMVISSSRGQSSLVLHNALEPANRLEIHLFQVSDFPITAEERVIGGYTHWLTRQHGDQLSLEREPSFIPPYSFLILDQPWAKLRYQLGDSGGLEKRVEYFFTIPPYRAAFRLAGSPAWVEARQNRVEASLATIRAMP